MQRLRHLVGNHLARRIVFRRDDAEAADPHLDRAGIDPADRAEIGLDDRLRACGRAISRLRVDAAERNLRDGEPPLLEEPPKVMASSKTFGLFASIM